MTIPLHFFRLRRRGKPVADAKTFRAGRSVFKYELASVFIDVRLEDKKTPLILEIAREAKGRAEWLGVLGEEGESRVLPEGLRWESAANLYDALVKIYWAGLAPDEPDAGKARKKPASAA